jgi:GNAT superfamily N-acetyltransferase
MHLVIRQAEGEDLADILDIYRELETNESFGLTKEQAGVIFDRISSYPDYKLYVAVADDETVGTFALAIMDNLAHSGMPSGLIEDVAVKKEWQGKGIGKQMMCFAIERCKERGCYKLALSSNKNRTGAHHFYESLGFEKHGYSFLIDLK